MMVAVAPSDLLHVNGQGSDATLGCVHTVDLLHHTGIMLASIPLL